MRAFCMRCVRVVGLGGLVLLGERGRVEVVGLPLVSLLLLFLLWGEGKSCRCGGFVLGKLTTPLVQLGNVCAVVRFVVGCFGRGQSAARSTRRHKITTRTTCVYYIAGVMFRLVSPRNLCVQPPRHHTAHASLLAVLLFH